MPVTVCKIGGSLLTLPDLAARLHRLIQFYSTHQLLFVVGGGASADIVREWDNIHRLQPDQSHWLAIKAMSLNEAMLCELLPSFRLAESRGDAERAWRDGHVAVLCAHRFLETEELQTNERLPHTWEVTSDSIAAWTTIHWPAERLVLVKSVPMHSHDAVDAHFSNLIGRINAVDWVNLRADEFRADGFYRRRQAVGET